MRYEKAPDLERRATELIETLGYSHVDLGRVAFVRSQGSKTRRTIARIHGMGKVFAIGHGIKPCYVVEFLSEKFDKMNEEQQTRTILHELMHIPHGFGGGFRKHKQYVNSRTVESEYNRLVNLKKGKEL